MRDQICTCLSLYSCQNRVYRCWKLLRLWMEHRCKWVSNYICSKAMDRFSLSCLHWIVSHFRVITIIRRSGKQIHAVTMTSGNSIAASPKTFLMGPLQLLNRYLKRVFALAEIRTRYERFFRTSKPTWWMHRSVRKKLVPLFPLLAGMKCGSWKTHVIIRYFTTMTLSVRRTSIASVPWASVRKRTVKLRENAPFRTKVLQSAIASASWT